ncbi:MAG: hypothetical protein M0Z94_20335 [Dehalococcoidales bacterium]|nr:hypothetical protein [Dehalococcoidales bacterium]
MPALFRLGRGRDNDVFELLDEAGVLDLSEVEVDLVLPDGPDDGLDIDELLEKQLE